MLHLIGALVRFLMNISMWKQIFIDSCSCLPLNSLWNFHPSCNQDYSSVNALFTDGQINLIYLPSFPSVLKSTIPHQKEALFPITLSVQQSWRISCLLPKTHRLVKENQTCHLQVCENICSRWIFERFSLEKCIFRCPFVCWRFCRLNSLDNCYSDIFRTNVPSSADNFHLRDLWLPNIFHPAFKRVNVWFWIFRLKWFSVAPFCNICMHRDLQFLKVESHFIYMFILIAFTHQCLLLELSFAFWFKS